jgi:hypothetical protein
VVPTATVLVDDPARPDAPKSESKPVQIYWQNESDASTFQGRAGELDLHNFGNSYDGHIQLRIDVEVSETFGTSDSVSQTGFTTLDTQEVVYDGPFYADRDACISAFEKTIRRYVRVSQIPLVFTLPDPAPEIRVALRLLADVIGELQTIRARNPEVGEALARALAATLQLPEQVLAPAVQPEGRPAAAPRTSGGASLSKRGPVSSASRDRSSPAAPTKERKREGRRAGRSRRA